MSEMWDTDLPNLGIMLQYLHGYPNHLDTVQRPSIDETIWRYVFMISGSPKSWHKTNEWCPVLLTENLANGPHHLATPLLFLIYIKDLPNEIKSICKIFADDTSLSSKVKDETFIWYSTQ